MNQGIKRFNKKNNQPLNKSNSLKEISSLSKVSVKELKNIRKYRCSDFLADLPK